jgi:hypothetical protein
LQLGDGSAAVNIYANIGVVWLDAALPTATRLQLHGSNTLVLHCSDTSCCAAAQASASDADSSLARARSDPVSLVCAGEAVSPECSDEDEAPPVSLASVGGQQQQQQQPPCSGSPLQPLPGAAAAAALVPSLGAVSCPATTVRWHVIPILVLLHLDVPRTPRCILSQRKDRQALHYNVFELKYMLHMAGAAAVDEEYDEDEFMDFDPYLFIRKLPPLDSVVTPIRDVLLPRQVG